MTLNKYIGIDIGGTAIKIGLIDECGNVIVKSETEIGERAKNESVMDILIASIRELSAIHGIDTKALSGIAVAAPGSIDTKNGRVAKSGGNLPDWGGTEVCRILKEEFSLPVSLANDGNCAALAEAWIGAAGDSGDVICLTLGTGVGGGIISGGSIVEGRNGYAGEVGHFVTHAGGRACSCGGRGCFEKYASTSALLEKAKTIKKTWCSGRELFSDAGQGDEAALELIEEWTSEIAYGIAGLIHIFNPQMVLIGGGVSAQEELVILPVSKKVKSLIMEDFTEDLVIKKAQLGNDAGMVGAVKQLINERTLMMSDEVL